MGKAIPSNKKQWFAEALSFPVEWNVVIYVNTAHLCQHWMCLGEQPMMRPSENTRWIDKRTLMNSFRVIDVPDVNFPTLDFPHFSSHIQWVVGVYNLKLHTHRYKYNILVYIYIYIIVNWKMSQPLYITHPLCRNFQKRHAQWFP